MTYPADPNQPPPYQPDQSAWSQGQAPNTGGFHPGQSQPGYGNPNLPPTYASAQAGYGLPTGPVPLGSGGPTPPQKSSTSKSLIALIAALAVAVVGLGVGLVLSLNRSDSASGTPGTVTVTEAGAGGGATVTETVTETEAGGFPTGEASPENSRVEGTIGEPLPRSLTDYDGKTTDFIVTLHSAEWKDELEGDYVDPPKDTFLVLDVTIEAVNGTVEYDPNDWAAKDEDGREYSDAFIFGADVNLLTGGTLAQGEKVRGAVIFDIPRAEISLVYTMGYGDLGVSYTVPA